MKQIIILLLLSLVFCSCSQTSQDCICTMEFRTVSTVVLDNMGRPIDSLIVSVKNKNSGKIYNFGETPKDYFGNYIVMTDQYTNEFNTTPSALIFEVSKGNAHKTVEFFITADECKCHISKAGGPDTVTFAIYK